MTGEAHLGHGWLSQAGSSSPGSDSSHGEDWFAGYADGEAKSGEKEKETKVGSPPEVGSGSGVDYSAYGAPFEDYEEDYEYRHGNTEHARDVNGANTSNGLDVGRDSGGDSGGNGSGAAENVSVGHNNLKRNHKVSHKGSSGSKYELIPIDHGYVLSTLNITWWDWTWLSWKQIKEPISPELVEWVQDIDPQEEERALELQLGRVLPNKVTMMLRLTTRLLKLTTAAGLTIREIAELVAREDSEVPSLLEGIVAQSAALTASDPRAGVAVEGDGERKAARGKGVMLTRSWSDNAVNQRGIKEVATILRDSSPSLGKIKDEEPSFVEGELKEEARAEDDWGEEEDLMTTLSSKVQSIPEGFWAYFDAALVRAIGKIKNDRPPASPV